jgi:hypothetical protein
MIEDFFPNPAALQRLHAGPLGAHIDAIAQEYSDHGFAVATATYPARPRNPVAIAINRRGVAPASRARAPRQRLQRLERSRPRRRRDGAGVQPCAR